MKNTKSKGFTLVELVIVIAVIAILAAVLIPTFSNLVQKANMSVDQQAVRQMNTVLAMEEVEEKPLTIEEVREIFEKSGYKVDSYTPIAKGTRFYWIKDLNRVVYVIDDSKNVIFPEEYEEQIYNASTWFTLDIEEVELSYDQQKVIEMNEMLQKILNDGNDYSEDMILDCLYAAAANKGYGRAYFLTDTANTAFYYIPEDKKIVLANEDKSFCYPLAPESTNEDFTTWQLISPVLGEGAADDESGRITEKHNGDVIGLSESIVVTALEVPTNTNYDLTSNGAYYKFEVNDEEHEKYLEKYADWYADYQITLNNPINDGFGKIIGCLGGYWRAIEVVEDLEAGFTISLMEVLTNGATKEVISYEDLADFEFICGACANQGFEFSEAVSITVQLRLYDPSTLNQEGVQEQYIVLTEILCVFQPNA